MAKKVDAEPAPVPAGPGKNRATPTRREAEQARRTPLVPTDRKAAARASRAKLAEERARARVGMAAGDERYLLARDRGPQRRYARDAVDAHWTLGEILFPVAGVFLVATFVIPTRFAFVLFPLLYVFIAIMVIDAWIRARRIRRRLAAKLGGEDQVERGLTWYVIGRCIQMRRLRTPKPRVRRGEDPR